MSDAFEQAMVLGVLVLFAIFVLGVQLVSIARDSDAWLILRGFTTGKCAQFRRWVRRG